jgi:hypothetical protein
MSSLREFAAINTYESRTFLRCSLRRRKKG